MPIRPVAVRNVFHSGKDVPRMSWSKKNLFNLWKRTHGHSLDAKSIDFLQHRGSIYQERWMSKRLTKGYHADFIANKVFERWYLPEALPTIRTGDHSKAATAQLSKWVEGRERAGGRSMDEKEHAAKAEDGGSPVGTMMFAEVERRVDVCVFRACFATSVYQARQFVLQRAVKVNGKIITNPNFLLSPGDVFSVRPDVITLINPKAWAKHAGSADPVAAEEAEAAAEEGVESAAAEEVAEGEEAEAASEKTDQSLTEDQSFSDVKVANSAPKETEPEAGQFFHLPEFAQLHVFVPAYILPSYLTCSAVYVRHPTARPGYSEIASPYDADGRLMSMTWEWYQKVAPRMKQSRRLRLMDPQRSQDRK